MLSVDIKKKLSKFELCVKFDTDSEVMGLLGMSGSGKSMTLKCIAGIEKPDEGKIILNGKVLFDSEKKINLPPQKRKIGYLFQDYALFPNMTVSQNIEVGISNLKNKGEIVENILREMDLLDKGNHYPNQISGGEKQRVALARIVVTKPEVLLLDEPFSALDEFLSWKIEMDLAESIENHVRNAILVSHDKDEVYRMTDTVCVLDRGESEEKRNTRELFENPNTYASGVLSGIKNFTRYFVEDEVIHLEEYGIDIKLESERHISESGLIGIKSYGLEMSKDKISGANVYPCKVVKLVESTDDITYLLQFSKGDNKNTLVLDEKKDKNLGISIGEMIYLKINESNIVIMERDVDIYYEF